MIYLSMFNDNVIVSVQQVTALYDWRFTLNRTEWGGGGGVKMRTTRPRVMIHSQSLCNFFTVITLVDVSCILSKYKDDTSTRSSLEGYNEQIAQKIVGSFIGQILGSMQQTFK